LLVTPETVIEFDFQGRTYAVRTRERNWPSTDGSPELHIMQIAGPPPAPAARWISWSEATAMFSGDNGAVAG
jgi:hypothetical protein